MKKVSILIIAILLLNGCNKDDDVGNITENTPTEGINIYTNSLDPLIVESKNEDGDVAQFYGGKDNSGRPLSFDQLRVTSDGKEQLYIYDELERPSSLLADNGTRFELEWLTNESFVLTIFTPDGLSQINTLVDLSDSENSKNIVSKLTPNRKRSTQLSYRSIENNNVLSNNDMANNYNVILNTFECFDKADAYPSRPYIVIQDEDGVFLRSIYPKRISMGEYGATIPNDQAPSINGQEVCEDIAGFINSACNLPHLPSNFFTTMCLSISTTLASTGIGASVAAQVLAACEALVLGYELSCSLYGSLDTSGLKDALCNANFVNQTWTENLKLTGVVSALPNNISSDPIIVPGEGPYPAIELDLGNETDIKSFFINPSAPASGQDYNAIARISCIKPGMVVELSVVGTDGYSDTSRYSISESNSLGEFSLNVPGAEAGIQDTITINVYLEFGETLVRTASIVFGA